MDEKLKIQSLFVDSLKAVIPSGLSAVQEIADLLQISTDSAYRRLRCETEFSLSEVVILSRHFHLSMEGFTSAAEGSVHFHYNIAGNKTEGFIQYLGNLQEGLKMLMRAREKEIIYVADDIPFFHLFRYPQLAWFKCYYWMKSVMNVSDYQNSFFEDTETPEPIRRVGTEIGQMYSELPSIEIWSENTINSLTKQIEFYRESGFFKTTETSSILFDQLYSLINDIRGMCESSSKLNISRQTTNYTFYLCDIEIGNNCIYISSGNGTRVFLRHSTFNTLETSDNTFCCTTRKWTDGLMKKSTQLSGMAEKQRNRFFQNMLKNIEFYKSKL